MRSTCYFFVRKKQRWYEEMSRPMAMHQKFDVLEQRMGGTVGALVELIASRLLEVLVRDGARELIGNAVRVTVDFPLRKPNGETNKRKR